MSSSVLTVNHLLIEEHQNDRFFYFPINSGWNVEMEGVCEKCLQK